MIDVYNFIYMSFKSVSEFVSGIPIFMYKWQDLSGALLGAFASFWIAMLTLSIQRRIDRENLDIQRQIDRENLDIQRQIDRENLKKQVRPLIQLEIPFAENDFEKGKRVIDETKPCLCPIKIVNISNNLASNIVVKVNYEYKGKSYNIDFSKHLIPVLNGGTTSSSIYLWNTGVDRSSSDSKPGDSIYELSFIKDPKMPVAEFFESVKINNIVLFLTTIQFERLQYTFSINQNMYNLFYSEKITSYCEPKISKEKKVS